MLDVEHVARNKNQAVPIQPGLLAKNEESENIRREYQEGGILSC